MDSSKSSSMTNLRRRLNSALGECRSQATVTARRLVGGVNGSRLARRPANANQSQRQEPTRGDQKQRCFSYSLTPASGAARLNRSSWRNLGDEPPATMCQFAAPQPPRVPIGRMEGNEFDPSEILRNISRHHRPALDMRLAFKCRHRGSSRRRTSHNAVVLLSNSKLRSSGRRKKRQVRFQPIPHSIDISNHYDSSFCREIDKCSANGNDADDDEEEDEGEEEDVDHVEEEQDGAQKQTLGDKELALTPDNNCESGADFSWGSDFDEHSIKSSSSSSGLDSNHSGSHSSHDSGNSTQHSNYSIVNRLKATIQTTDGVPPGPVAKSPEQAADESQSQSPVAGPMSEATNCSLSPTSSSSNSEEQEQESRRNRFLQNRLIINSKLESIFSNHSAARPRQSQTKTTTATKLQTSPTTARVANPQAIVTAAARSPPSFPAKKPDDPMRSLDQQTRVRLLEEQRQISLKLKQKPRRKRIFDVRAEPAPCQQSSLTKQLSMICLRKLEKLNIEESTGGSGGDDDGACSTSASRQEIRESPARPALSLRQLVKEVIDDCEQPSKLSTLTRNMLNRSDSLSSETQLACVSEASGSSSPLADVARVERKTSATHELTFSYSDSGDDDDDEDNDDHESDHAQRPQHSTPQGADKTSAPDDKSPIKLRLFEAPTMSVVPMSPYSSDLSQSTIGTIDGLEFINSFNTTHNSSCLSKDEAETNAISVKNLNELPYQLKTSIGNYWRNLRDFSRFKAK